MVGPSRRACRVPSPRRHSAWCEECVTAWASTGCRPWGARRTRSTPTSWRAISLPRGMAAPRTRTTADLVVVNTCAFIDAARQESIDTVLTLADRRRPGARLVVTGCMAERYGDELREALPEVDLVAGFGAELTDPPARASAPSRSPSPWAPRRRAAAPADQRVRPPGAAPPGGPRPVGLREGGRGLRPHLRLLRHPVVPGQAALTFDRRDPGRGRRAARHRRRRAGPPRDRPRGPGPRLLRPRPLRARPADPHRQRPVAHRRAHPRRVGRGSSAPACSTSIPPG